MPCAVVDLAAFAANARLMLDRAAITTGKPPTLRIATKSLRVPELIRRAQSLLGSRSLGLMTYSAAETLMLADQGFDDFLLAYPVSQPAEARLLATLAARNVTLRVIVDSRAHVDLLAAHLPPSQTSLSLALDIDASWRLLAGKVHLGVRRSPLRTPDDALTLAAYAQSHQLRVTAVMLYEAQVAGLRDTNPGSRHLDPLRRFIRARSKPLAASRRFAVVDALRSAGHRIAVVNGGGTGSIDSTASDGSVTEVTIGSGFLTPHLFDHYAGLPLTPAAFFLLPVTRVPDPGYVTAFCGGFIASGPPATDRAPRIHAPPGLAPTAAEGFGEVQSPFTVSPAAPSLQVGDPIVCRHAKSGELFERFNEVHLVDVPASSIVATVPTYRGLGGAFG